MCFLLYLRPGEPFRLRVRDIVSPAKKAGKSHPNEVGIPSTSRTMQWDEMLGLDLPHMNFLGPALDYHLKLPLKQKQQLAFSIQLSDVNTFMAQEWSPLRLDPLGHPHMHRLPHGGASFEAANKLGDLQGIQARGRWMTMKSVKNYEKGGRLHQLFMALDKAHTRSRGTAAKDNIAKIFRLPRCSKKGC